jgi:hypothetical protein
MREETAEKHERARKKKGGGVLKRRMFFSLGGASGKWNELAW